MAPNFSKLTKDIKSQIKKPTLEHIIVKLLKIKDKEKKSVKQPEKNRKIIFSMDQ